MMTITVEIYKITNVFTGIDLETQEPILVEKPELSVKAQWYFNDPQEAFKCWKKALVDKPLCPIDEKWRLSLYNAEAVKDGFISEFVSGTIRYVIAVSEWWKWENSVQKKYHITHTTCDVYHPEFGVTEKTTKEYWFHKEDEFKAKVLELCPDFEWEFDETVSYPYMYKTQRGVCASYEYFYGDEHN